LTKIQFRYITIYMKQVVFDTNKHSVFLLHYHLVLVTKYRMKVITDSISKRLEEIFKRVGKKHYVILEKWGAEKDHVYILFRARPSTHLSRFINAYKNASSRLIKKEFPEIRQKLWKGYFWSRSYCLLTTGGAPIEVIKKYLESHRG